MQSIIYDVAVSVDGFIAGPSGDVSQFAHEGPVVEDYQARLVNYSAAIMGRNTYEFGYQFSMMPGENPYAHMKTIVFSSSIDLRKCRSVEVVTSDIVQAVQTLKASVRGPVYLCGGGEFAGSLLAMGLIDKLRLKRAPIILGGGTRLFGGVEHCVKLRHIRSKTYECGYLFQDFELIA